MGLYCYHTWSAEHEADLAGEFGWSTAQLRGTGYDTWALPCPRPTRAAYSYYGVRFCVPVACWTGGGKPLGVGTGDGPGMPHVAAAQEVTDGRLGFIHGWEPWLNLFLMDGFLPGEDSESFVDRSMLLNVS